MNWEIDLYGHFGIQSSLYKLKTPQKKSATTGTLLSSYVASSISSANTPYPRLGSLTNTWVTAPIS